MGRTFLLILLALPAWARAESGDYLTKKAYRYVTEPAPVTRPAQTRTYLYGGPQPKHHVGLRLGGAFPVGDFALFHQPGPSLGIDYAYRYLVESSLEASLVASTHAFKGKGGEAPFRALGITLKSLTDFWRQDAVSAFVGMGVGCFSVQRNREHLIEGAVPAPQYQAVPENTMALCLLGSFGIHYQLPKRWSARLEVQLMDLNLSGGTSDNFLTAQPTLGLRRGF